MDGQFWQRGWSGLKTVFLMFLSISMVNTYFYSLLIAIPYSFLAKFFNDPIIFHSFGIGTVLLAYLIGKKI